MRIKTEQNHYLCSCKYMKMVESKQIECSVLSFPEETIFTIGDLNLPMLSWDNIRVKLGRMVNEGVLRKAGKGRFYRPKTSIFGEVMPSQEEIVKDLLWDGDTPTGYITGYSRWNEMGLTTQISGIIQIGINGVKRNLDRGGYSVRFIKQPNEITVDNIKYLVILDAINNIRKIPDTTVVASLNRLAVIIKRLGADEIEIMTGLAKKYPARLRALLGAMLENIGYESLSSLLYETLNPLTSYDYPGLSAHLSNSLKWHIK